MAGAQSLPCGQIVKICYFATRYLPVIALTKRYNYTSEARNFFQRRTYLIQSIRIASRCSHQVCLLSSDRIILVMDDIDTFFASFPTFQYSRNASSPQEFRRMCQFFGWRKVPNDMYPIERLEATAKFHLAMVRTFNREFVEDVEVKQAWLFLCTVLGVEPMPNTIGGMKEVS